MGLQFWFFHLWWNLLPRSDAIFVMFGDTAGPGNLTRSTRSLPTGTSAVDDIPAVRAGANMGASRETHQCCGACHMAKAHAVRAVWLAD